MTENQTNHEKQSIDEDVNKDPSKSDLQSSIDNAKKLKFVNQHSDKNDKKQRTSSSSSSSSSSSNDDETSNIPYEILNNDEDDDNNHPLPLNNSKDSSKNILET